MKEPQPDIVYAHKDMEEVKDLLGLFADSQLQIKHAKDVYFRFKLELQSRD